jgi:uncharacterized protein YcbX
MPIKVGEVEALFRYPVKSMSGELLEVADLGGHGLDGDRRLAFCRADDRGGFPWLTASKLPELILFAPRRRGPAVGGDLPTHVRTPEGEELAVFGPELATEVGRRHGSPVEMMYLNRGIFDVGGVLSFGETREAAVIGITNRDERCSMVNFDPGSARPTAEVLKAIVRVRDNRAGVYGTVTRRGRLAVGQPVFFEPAAEAER